MSGLSKPIYKDLGDEKEDARIRQIGEAVMNLPSNDRTVGFITDAEEGKADRYIAKLQERYPGVRVVARGNGPVEKTVWVKVGPPVN